MPPPNRGSESSDVTQRERDWAATMAGEKLAPTVRTAHAGHAAACTVAGPVDRAPREAREDATMCPEATRARGAGERTREEAPDPLRTCFERDRDRILHASAFRRLAGKTQVFVAPADHQRTRLTHALEVAQVARSLAASLGLNVALAEAIALGHDCGHGPGGHASEDALSPFIPEGYDHAVWGADVALADLNLCRPTLDGIRNHSWSRPAPSTPEGEVTSWADRIAYVCHDFEDAVAAGVVAPDQLPDSVIGQCGRTRREQLAAFIGGVVSGVECSGLISMAEPMADALADFRRFNYHHIYLRDVSRFQAARVVEVLGALVHHYAGHPGDLPVKFSGEVDATRTPEAYRAAVTYVGGMTDQFAFETAVRLLEWDRSRLPDGIDVARH